MQLIISNKTEMTLQFGDIVGKWKFISLRLIYNPTQPPVCVCVCVYHGM